MGADVKLGEAPRFSIRAAGAFVQKPGCPDGVTRAGMTAERLQHLCAGECYNPGDERLRITRVEVVRIRRQRRPDEPIAPLIEDVYRRMDCPKERAVCEVAFEDPDFVEQGRDAVYYVRAIQEPTAAVNAASLRCERDAKGNCMTVKPCYGDARTPLDEDCLADTEERAWSSPIYVHFDAEAAKAAEESKGEEEQHD
jgi:hypothetical protein